MSLLSYVENSFRVNYKTQQTRQSNCNCIMSNQSSRLDNPILAEYEFTLRDEVVSKLLDFVECPILKEESQCMVIFNKQCYDYEKWVMWLDVQDEVNAKKSKSGYGPSLCDQLIDPMSGKNVGYRNSMRHDFFHGDIPRQKLADILIQRIPLLYLEETDEFLPPGDPLGVDEVVQYIKDKAKPRQHVRDAYMAALNNRSRSGDAGASPYPNTRSRASIANNSPAATTNATNAGETQPTETSDGVGTSDTVATLGDNNDGVAVGTNITSTVPSDVGNDVDSDNNSPIDTIRRRFRFGRVMEDSDEDSGDGKVGETENVEIGDDPEDQLNGTSPENAIPLLSQVENNEASVTTASTVTNNGVSGIETNTANVDNDPNDEAIFARGIPAVGGPGRKLPPIPSFTDSNDGEVICLGILQLAKNAGYQNTLIYGRRTTWFNEKLAGWMEPGGIMHGYSKPHRKNLSGKFRAAENIARQYRNRRIHQTDSSGDRDESRPLWMNAFQDYLQFAEDNPSARVLQIRESQRREVVTRSVIGQQAALSPQVPEVPTLLPTTRPPGTQAGPNLIAETVNVRTNSGSGSASSDNRNADGRSNIGSPSRRPLASNRPSTRPRRTNVDFGLSRNPLLPPSTGQWQPFDIHRMESSYVAIANSINNLAAHQLIRRPNDVNSEIIRTIQEKNVAARNGGNNELLSAFDEKLKDLNDELEMARSFHRSIVNNLRNQTNEESEPTED